MFPYRLYWRKRRDERDQTQLAMEILIKELKWDIYLSIVHHHKQLDELQMCDGFRFLKKKTKQTEIQKVSF